MSKGVLIFAHDNGDTEYVRLASWAAQRIDRHLALPVTLVTDRVPDDSSMFDQVIIHEAGTGSFRGQYPWRNMGRFRAGDLTPYDQTLLLDADYVVCSDQLKCLFESNQCFLSMRWAYDITARHNYDNLNFFGRHRMPSAWATMIYWHRGRTAQHMFDMMGHVQDNWLHYVNLYGLADRKFRNDFALAIASNTVMGHLGHWPEIPWAMPNVESGSKLSQLDSDRFEIKFLDHHQKSRRIIVDGLDFHAMGKKDLGNLIENSS